MSPLKRAVATCKSFGLCVSEAETLDGGSEGDLARGGVLGPNKGSGNLDGFRSSSTGRALAW